MVMAMRFKRLSDCIVFSYVVRCSVVDLRIELSATRLSAVYGQPALDYLCCLSLRESCNTFTE